MDAAAAALAATASDRPDDAIFCTNHACCLQVLAWLRCKVDASAAALAATSSGAYAGVDKRSLQHYGVGLLTEWLPPARLAALQKALGIAVDGADGTF